MNLTSIDVVFILIISVTGIFGAKAGAVRFTAPFGLILALVALFHSYPAISAGFGPDPTVRFFMMLLCGFIGLVIYGLTVRILHESLRTSGFGSFNTLLGLLLGLTVGTLLAGLLIWGLEQHASVDDKALLNGSSLAPGIRTFFLALMDFTQRLFRAPMRKLAGLGGTGESKYPKP